MSFIIPEASEEFEVVVGSDGIVRINVDGLCEYRIRMRGKCRFTLRHMGEPDEIAQLVNALRTGQRQGTIEP